MTSRKNTGEVDDEEEEKNTGKEYIRKKKRK